MIPFIPRRRAYFIRSTIDCRPKEQRMVTVIYGPGKARIVDDDHSRIEEVIVV